ncbi:MAG TPA: hypothetical protein VHG35_00075 [Gemmatimonadales bacterium]|nr:hypothetical protein [Gemmatimonadales bacterium]
MRKIELRRRAVNAHERSLRSSLRQGDKEMSMSLTLLAAIGSLIAWIVLLFFTPVTAGAIHLLLALGTTLLVRWWALRA